MKTVYADFAAATPTDPAVITAMMPYFDEQFGNPSSAHQLGYAAAEAINQANQAIGRFLNCDPGEVFYTSGGTESNNLAIIGVAKANRGKGRHLITTLIEHPSVLNACKALEKDGWQVTYLPVTKSGLVEAGKLQTALTKETVLVSIHLANSEIGVIQDIPNLAKIAQENGVLFHTDTCQAATFIRLDVEKLGVDLLTFNGGKIYGPKGVAVLYVKQGTSIFPIIYGGGQQESLRSGTENVPGIIGLAVATKLAETKRDQDWDRIARMRDQLQDNLTKLPGVTINCADVTRLPNHLSVTFTQTNETNLVKYFNEGGVALSSGSACSAKSLVDSHVLQAIGLPSELIHKTVRISLGRSTTPADINKITEIAANV